METLPSSFNLVRLFGSVMEFGQDVYYGAENGTALEGPGNRLVTC